MYEVTLCFLVRGEPPREVLLGLKKIGLGADIRVVARGGKTLLLYFACVASVLVLQNLVGVTVAVTVTVAVGVCEDVGVWVRGGVFVRVGENARGWEDSALPNAVLKGLPSEDAGPARSASPP